MMRKLLHFCLTRTGLLGLLLVPALAGAPASAAMIVTAVESGADVIISGSGSFDLGGLALPGTGSSAGGILPNFGSLGLGFGNSPVDIYGGLSGPSSFGTGFTSFPTSGTAFTFATSGSSLVVVTGYVSNDALVGSSTYAGQSLATLGLTPGSYIWSWGAGANADSLTLNVVPEPSVAALLTLGLVGLVWARRGNGTQERVQGVS